MLKYVTFCFIFLFLNSCTKKADVQKSMIDGSGSNELQHANNLQFVNPEVVETLIPEDSKPDKGKLWLENIFTCGNYKYKYCFLLDKEEQVCTKRFFEFMMDSEQIFGASNLEENEFPNAIKKYKKKWSKIYPLRTEETGEPWLFGRGQDDMLNIKNVEIKKISNLKYNALVNYDGEYKTESTVTLVPSEKSFKIDYCSTKFL